MNMVISNFTSVQHLNLYNVYLNIFIWQEEARFEKIEAEYEKAEAEFEEEKAELEIIEDAETKLGLKGKNVGKKR